MQFKLLVFEDLVIRHTIFSSENTTCKIIYHLGASCQNFATHTIITAVPSIPHQCLQRPSELQHFFSYHMKLPSVFSAPSVKPQKVHISSCRRRRRTIRKCFSWTFLLVQCLWHNHSHVPSIRTICARCQSLRRWWHGPWIFPVLSYHSSPLTQYNLSTPFGARVTASELQTQLHIHLKHHQFCRHNLRIHRRQGYHQI